LFAFLRIAPLVLCFVLAAMYLLSNREITVEGLLNYAPENPMRAALFMILLYALKSLTIFFPIIVLNILGGFLFDPLQALFINSIGILIDSALPYLIGKYSGSGLTKKLVRRYPKFAEILAVQQNNDAFMTFFLRVISCLPGDIVSMYLGTTGIPFGKYLLASYLGILPGMVAATLLGMSITDPTSPMFWISVGLTVGISVLSFLIYYLWKRKQRKKEGEI